MDSNTADNMKGNLPLSLPADITAIIARVEATENWVSSSPFFLSGQKKLFYLLSRLRSQLPYEDFSKHFVVVTTFSSFRDGLALMRILSKRHEDHLQLFLARALSGMIPEDNLCWRAHLWRIRYLTAINVLARVFDEHRIERVKAALSKED